MNQESSRISPRRKPELKEENLLLETKIEFSSSAAVAIIGSPLMPTVTVINLKGPQNNPPKHSLLFNWYRVHSQGSNTKGLWLSSVKYYRPVEADLGYRLNVEVYATNGTTSQVISKPDEAQSNPVARPPSRISRHFIDVSRTDGECLKILTYNVLASHLAYGNSVSMLPKWAIDWDFRSQYLLAEIMEYKADIICLQEVQTDHFETFFKLPLEQQGYELFYKKKTDFGFYTGKESVTDGCVTCVRTDRFRLMKTYELEFRNIVEEIEHGHRLRKDNIALVVVLETVGGESVHQRICVANTHISADPGRPDIKLYQVAKLLNGLEKISLAQVPILLCGDFNSIPGSNVYDFLVEGKVDDAKLKDDYDQLAIFPRLKLTHALNLKSAYSAAFHKLCASLLSQSDIAKHLESINLRTHEPSFTTFTNDFTEAVDYIFYSADDFEVLSVLELLGVADLSGYWSSDHIPLVAKLRLMQSRLPADLPVDLWKRVPITETKEKGKGKAEM